jgi:hypothetical protein
LASWLAVRSDAETDAQIRRRIMPVNHVQNGRSMTEVLQDIVANIQEIFRSEFRLAKAEIHEETTKFGR